MEQVPGLLPIRRLNGRWQVLLAERNRWFVFRNESDARRFSKVKQLQYKAMHGGFDCEELAAELEYLAELLRFCRVGFDYTVLELCATAIRRRAAKANALHSVLFSWKPFFRKVRHHAQ